MEFIFQKWKMRLAMELVEHQLSVSKGDLPRLNYKQENKAMFHEINKS